MARNTPHDAIDVTWNPVTGCTPVSAGCDHCYARTIAERSRGKRGHPYEQGFDLRLWPERLELPLRWKAPRRVFVDSMSDLFHPGVPDEFIRRVFQVMERASQHHYLILTKRPQRLARLGQALPWPPHVWIGVSVESNEVAWRADFLRKVPAATRFICAEPLIGPIDRLDLAGISWVTAGGETGRGHRPCDPAWVRGLRDRCVSKGVAFSFRHWGGLTRQERGRVLDGRVWEEIPPVLRPATLPLPI